MSWNTTPEGREKKRAYDAARKAWQTPERKAYMKAWHAANPRDRRAYKKAYDEANRERNAAYYAANAERRSERKKRYYRENRERVLAQVMARAETMREELAAYGREWGKRYRAQNPERVQANSAHQKARRRGAGGSHTAEEWREKCAEFGGLCAYCREARPLERDHVVPVSRGGSDYIDNILPACMPCNRSKGARRPEEWVGGVGRDQLGR